MTQNESAEQSVHSFAVCRYHALTAVQSLAVQLQQLSRTDGSGGAVSGAVSSSSSSGGGGGSTAEAARPLFEVMMNAAPTPPADSFPDGVSSWSGAAEVSLESQWVRH